MCTCKYLVEYTQWVLSTTTTLFVGIMRNTEMPNQQKGSSRITSRYHTNRGVNSKERSRNVEHSGTINDIESLVELVHKMIKDDPKRAKHFITRKLSESVRANVLSQRRNGDTALSLSISVGATDLMTCLLRDYDVDVEQSCRGVIYHDGVANTTEFTALLKAVSCNNLEAVKVLLELGADMDACTENGYTALHGATSLGNLGMVQALCEAGANVNLKTCIGTSGLMNAKRNPEIRRFLVSNDADCLAVNAYGRTALHQAVLEGCIESVRLFLENGMDIDRKDAEGNTALHIAVYNGHGDIVKLLLQKNADPYHRNDNCEDCFLIAASKDRPTIMELLLESHQTSIAQNSGE